MLMRLNDYVTLTSIRNDNESIIFTQKQTTMIHCIKFKQ
jgi:hypothetical protein